MAQVRFGLAPNLYPPELIFQAAELCEQSGLDALWLADHVVAFGVRRFAAVDAWSTLAALAVKTSRIGLGTCVSDPHRRHPETLAQIVATVDHLSRGRVILGLGPGESMNLDPFGVEWSSPVSRLEEAVQVIKALWTQEEVSFHGKHFKLREAVLDLKPFQKPHPPIWFGANSPRTIRLAAQLADGWIPIARGPDVYRDQLMTLEAHARALGRDPEAITKGLFTYIGVAPEIEQARSLFEVPAKVVYVFNEYPEHHFARVPLTRAKAAQVLSKALQLDIGLERLRERLGIPLGTPEDCVGILEKYVEAGARYFILAPLTRPEEFLKVAQFCVDLVIPELS